jgi:hypothetical protein
MHEFLYEYKYKLASLSIHFFYRESYNRWYVSIQNMLSIRNPNIPRSHKLKNIHFFLSFLQNFSLSPLIV